MRKKLLLEKTKESETELEKFAFPPVASNVIWELRNWVRCCDNPINISVVALSEKISLPIRVFDGESIEFRTRTIATRNMKMLRISKFQTQIQVSHFCAINIL